MRFFLSGLCLLAAVLLPLSAPRAEDPAPVPLHPTPLLLASNNHDSSCEITGTVNYLKKVERSPYSDGTPAPSGMSVSETHISVTVVARRPHAKDAPATSKCNAKVEDNERQMYKLCSSTVPKPGDRILGTEGGSPGSANLARCLFDVVAIPAKRKG